MHSYKIIVYHLVSSHKSYLSTAELNDGTYHIYSKY